MFFFRKIVFILYGFFDFENLFLPKTQEFPCYSKTWKKIDYGETIKKETGIDIFSSKKQDIEKKLRELKEDFQPGLEKGRLMDILWKHCRRKISGPAFLVGQPVEVSPLAKRDSKDNRKVEQFQIILGGSEVGNGYSELNDPIDQEKRFKEQKELKEKGDSEAHEHDEEFIEALKILAKRAGITLSHFQPTQEAKLKEKLYEINHLASEFFHYLLTKHTLGKRGREYLEKRRIKKETVEEALVRNPVVSLIGPRQCGKTTLARKLQEFVPNFVIGNGCLRTFYVVFNLGPNTLLLCRALAYCVFGKIKFTTIFVPQNPLKIVPIRYIRLDL